MSQGKRAGEPGDAEAKDTAKRGRYPKGIHRRQQILDRTIEVFAEFGFEGTSLRAIGEAIGVSHAALRRYFDTREELFLEVLHEKDRQALADARVDVVESIDFASHLEDYVTRAPGLVALRHSMVARALEPGNERSRTFFVERYESIRREALLILRLAKAAGTVRDDISPEVAASLVIATMDGLSTQCLLDSRVDLHAGMTLLEHLLKPVGK
ncbi:TetR/AcrR family transcriptional regulator [Amycolatopsis jiangsuensis]|uniref:AcrR family transcriptional regulator n=1 Tax=Amycolatopsis jiangsuensis TaxID=1181879 RepID=A0A840IPH2_9PSEU|nr:TetR/AcrR family transcriptional regulator [Amycolatopsis jiangsuensis]MBB4684391.1 AcrR family transcriptional regulator [Amycolatopsis jiangsuensis]